MLTQESLKELLEYSPETGKFFWRVSRPHVGQGDEAGSLTAYGYIAISVNNVKYPAHRLAWLFIHGEWPEERKVVDHINRDKLDNRICNLRVVTHQINQFNRSSTKGYHFDKARGKWVATIKLNYRTLFLGRFDTEKEASDAYNRAKEKAT